MGTMVGVAEDDGGMLEENVVQTITSSLSSTKQIGNPVVYKLVRVGGDGRLVPATDDQIMEVKDLLENDKTNMHIVTDTGHNAKCISNEGVSSGLLHLESSEVLSQSDNTEPDADKANSRLEEMLQNVEEEERLCSTLRSPNQSAYVNVEIQCSDQNYELAGEEDKVPPETPLQEPVTSSLEVVKCSKPADGPKEAASISVAVNSSSKPDFSKLKGEICLDNLTIRELQETFRATFGRETTVKDKRWLKRRIAMGLTNSCDIPDTSFIIKDYKLVTGKEETCNGVSLVFTNETTNEARADDNSKDSTGLFSQAEGDQSASGNSPGDNFRDCCFGSEDFDVEHRAAKRVRRPTKRYIEELSETESKHPGVKSMASLKDPRQTPKSQVSSVRTGPSGARTVVTRMISLAGSRIQVPCVSHVRRSRPRENIMALVEFDLSCIVAKATPRKNSQCLSSSQLESEKGSRILTIKSASEQIQQENKQDSAVGPIEVDHILGPKHVDSYGGNSSSDNVVSVPTAYGGFRRKHHRAWTLSEVMKLVEGVARYGAGKWSEIRRLSFSSYSYRTSVDLKDKWRNLLKASFALTPSDKRASFRKHGSMPIPTSILLRVRELAEKQAHVTLTPSTSQPAEDGSNTVNESRPGFL